MCCGASLKRGIAMNDFRNGYASRADFCKVFESEMDRLYLLAFLLTANHEMAERCFLHVVEQVHEVQSVFGPFLSAWIRRCLIKDAVATIFRQPLPREYRHDAWYDRSEAGICIDAVAQLAPIERFAFVMTALECYSAKECSLLLGCESRAVAEAKVRALKRLGRNMRDRVKETEYVAAIA
jgi:DNA-directed RNA polymerase specialized sigma24 family protein